MPSFLLCNDFSFGLQNDPPGVRMGRPVDCDLGSSWISLSYVYNENGKSFHPAIPPMLSDGDGVITLSSSRRRGCSIRDVCVYEGVSAPSARFCSTHQVSRETFKCAMRGGGRRLPLTRAKLRSNFHARGCVESLVSDSLTLQQPCDLFFTTPTFVTLPLRLFHCEERAEIYSACERHFPT